MSTAQITNLQKFTKLPIRVVATADRIFPDVLVKTPHKGELIIRLTEKNYPFLFGSVTQTEKNLGEVIREIRAIEKDAVDYLLREWLRKSSVE